MILGSGAASSIVSDLAGLGSRAGISHARGKAGVTGAGGASGAAHNVVVSNSTSTAPDGSSRTVVTYADGTTSVSTSPASSVGARTTAKPVTGAGRNGLVDSRQGGQLSTLLAAQEQAVGTR